MFRVNCWRGAPTSLMCLDFTFIKEIHMRDKNNNAIIIIQSDRLLAMHYTTEDN